MAAAARRLARLPGRCTSPLQAAPRTKPYLSRATTAAAAPGGAQHPQQSPDGVAVAAAADARFMRLALQQAQAAFDAGEVPVGAVLVVDSQVVAASANATEARRNPLCHAELLCISAAAEQQLAWRLQDATLYSTLEPCPMCAGAILQARLARLVYGARQPRVGADGSWVALFPAAAGQQHQQHGCTQQQQQQQERQQGQQQQQDRGSPDVVHPTGPHPFHPSIAVTRGVLQEECGALMRVFFRLRRQRQQQQQQPESADNPPPQPGERQRSSSFPDAAAPLFDAAAGQQLGSSSAESSLD